MHLDRSEIRAWDLLEIISWWAGKTGAAAQTSCYRTETWIECENNVAALDEA